MMSRLGNFLTAASIASLESLAVVSLANPTELNSRVGSAGQKVLVYQVVATADEGAIYQWEAANSGGASAPYVMAASGTGFWVANFGRYINQAVTIRSTLTSNSDTDGTTILGRVKVGSAAGTDQATFSHFDHGSASNYALRQNSSGNTFINAPTGGSIGFRINDSDQATLSAAGGFNLSLALVAGSSGSFVGQGSFGGSVASAAVLTLGQTNPLTGTTQTGCFVNITGTSAGTTALRGGQFSIATVAASYTVTDAVSLLASSVGKGAGSTITRATGAWIADQSNGTNNCGLFIGTSLSYTGNYALLSTSTALSQLAGKLTVTDTTNATDSATAAVVTSGGIATAKDAWFGANLTAGVSVSLNCAAGNLTALRFMAANTLRWQFIKTGTQHDFSLSAYDASGVSIDSPISIPNAAGSTMSLSRPIAAAAGVRTGSTAFDQTNAAAELLVGRTGTSAWSNTTCAYVGYADATYPLNTSGVNGELVLASRTSSSIGISFATNNAVRMSISGAGNIGIGGTAGSIAMLNVNVAGSVLSSSAQQGLRCDITGTAAATGSTVAVVGITKTTASAFTCGLAAGAYFSVSSLGAGSTITRGVGSVHEVGLGTNKAGVLIIANGGTAAFTGTWALYSESTASSRLSGILQVGGTGSISGTSRIQVTGSSSTEIVGMLMSDTAGKAWLIGSGAAVAASGNLDFYNSTDSKLRMQVTPAGLLTTSFEDATTAALSTVATLTHATSGTAATNFGSSLTFGLHSNSAVMQTAGAIDVWWTNAINASFASAVGIRSTFGAGIRYGLMVFDYSNVAIGAITAPPDMQSAQGVIFIGNRNAAPVGNPTSGGYLYVESGALKYKGIAGTTTTIAVS
jgi:hypothetical protein